MFDNQCVHLSHSQVPIFLLESEKNQPGMPDSLRSLRTFQQLIPDIPRSASPPFPLSHRFPMVDRWRWTQAHSGRPAESLVYSSAAFPGALCPREATGAAERLRWSVFPRDRGATAISPCSEPSRTGSQARWTSHERSSRIAACGQNRWRGNWNRIKNKIVITFQSKTLI